MKEAAAVVIVLSTVSVTKPWVREELNAAVVKRIEKGTKIIPIVLDGCDVPEALRSLLWEPVRDVDDFGDGLSRVVDAVFGHTAKPPIGAAPAYIATPAVPTINGLNTADSLVLKTLYDEFLERGRDYVSPNVVIDATGSKDLDVSIVSESLGVLEHQGLIELLKHLGPGPYHARIQPYGVSVMLGDQEPPLVRQVGLSIVNDNLTQSPEIAKALDLSLPLVNYAIDRLEGSGHLKASKSMGGSVFVHNVNPALRRALAS
ncbi:TIR domain-containing protein [Paraburkholderia sp. MM5482-R1]|uniref:TIR domain-containing protein n=1 Tax=Paraburkholderia sp. MM5482-R1 TaxID=2991063 RepID=UPI003D211CE7